MDAHRTLVRRLLVVVALGGTAILGLGDVVDPDLWGHVRYGQDVLASGAIPWTTTHSFTAVGHPWINHENLAELAFAAIMNAVGAPGLLALKTGLGLLVIGLMVDRARRRRARLSALALVVMLVAYCLATGWNVRPQLFSYAFFALLVWGVDQALAPPDGLRFRRLWWVPLVFALWANTHGGFVAGLAVLTLYLGARAGTALVRREPSGGHDAAVAVFVAVASALACLATPYGMALVGWLARSLAVPRPEISEWGPLALADPRALPASLLGVLAIVACARRDTPRDPVRALVLAVVAWQAIVHVRHLPFFAILCGLWLPERFPSPDGRAIVATETGRPAPPLALRAAVYGVLVLLLGFLVARGRALPVDPRIYPVDAFRFMADRHVHGRLVAHFDWSQYALAAFPDDVTVAFDGRFDTSYPPEVVDMYFDFLLGDAGRRQRLSASPFDRRRILAFGSPDLVLVSRRYPDAAALLAGDADWVLLYRDPVAELWGRAARYDEARSVDFLPPSMRRVDAELSRTAVAWPALPARSDATTAAAALAAAPDSRPAPRL